MKKKMYEKPSVEVVKLQVQNQLLEGSGNADVQDYNKRGYDEE